MSLNNAKLTQVAEVLTAAGIENEPMNEQGQEGISLPLGLNAPSPMVLWFAMPETVFGERLVMVSYLRPPEGIANGETLYKTKRVLSSLNSRYASSIAETGKIHCVTDDDNEVRFISYVLPVPDEAIADAASAKALYDGVIAYDAKIQDVLDGKIAVEQMNGVASDFGAPAKSSSPAVGTPAADPVSQSQASVPAPSSVQTAQAHATAVSDVQANKAQPEQRVVNTAQTAAQITRPEAAQVTSQGSVQANSNKDDQAESDSTSVILKFVWIILSFIFPLLGFVLFFVWRQSKPDLSKRILIAAILGALIQVVPMLGR